MKRLFLSILMIFTALPIFALELQHDIFLGESDGFDTAIVFDSGKIKNSVGLYYDSHDTVDDSSESSYNDYSYSYSSYGSNHSDHDKRVSAIDLGLYYQFTWSPNFVELGNFAMGMDIPVQIGFGYDSYYIINCNISLSPAFKFEFRKFDLLIGYKGSVLIAEAIYGMPFFKNSCTLGIRYSIKKGATITSSETNSSTEAPDNSSQPKVNIIPGTDIKTINN